MPIPNLLPLTIGVVGHRRIAGYEIDRIRSQIKEIILNFQAQAPHTPIVLISSMAEGADQLAAEVAVEIEGVYVIAILPFPVDEYEKDFVSDSKMDTFRALLESVDKVLLAKDFYSKIELNKQALDHVRFSPDSDRERDLAYRDCGRLVSQQAHALIAIWDGKLSNLVAGTADTVAHRILSSREFSFGIDQFDLWPQEDGLLFHIQTERGDISAADSDQSSENLEHAINILNSDSVAIAWDKKTKDLTVEKFERLNNLILEKRKLDADGQSLSKTILDAVDGKATLIQSRFRALVSSLLIFGVFCLFFADVQHSRSGFGLYLLTVMTLTLMALIWVVFERGRFKEEFHELRLVAEGMRVQEAWLESGIEKSPGEDFLKGIPEVSWIPRSMRSAWLWDHLDHMSLEARTNSNADSPIEIVRNWLENQIQYFAGTPYTKGAIERSHRKHRFYEKLSIFGVCVAILCLLWDGLRFLPGGIFPFGLLNEISPLIMHLALSISAASIAYSQLMAFKEIERQYERSHGIFRQGMEILQGGVPQNLSKEEYWFLILIRVGREALLETGAWFALKRDRTVHPI
jgi:uncharacterized membrane protein